LQKGLAKLPEGSWGGSSGLETDNASWISLKVITLLS
jgi:hypothetical protein